MTSLKKNLNCLKDLFLMRKVNQCPKNIGLENIFRNILREKKNLILMTVFYIFYDNGIKTFFKLCINKCPKTPIN